MAVRKAGIALFVFISMIAMSAPALAQTGAVSGSGSITVGSATAPAKTAVGTSTCKLNGQVVPCDQLGKSVGRAVGLGLGLILFFLVLGLAASVFWLLMLIHAATHPIQNRALWIVVIVFMNLLGAIVYYFAVKRPFSRMAGAPAQSSGAGSDAGMASPLPAPVSPQLSEFVRASRQQGVADDATRQSLIAAGWNAADVDRALKS